MPPIVPTPPDDPSADSSTVVGPPSERSAETIGPYRILSLLGEGGMGAVYLAEQQMPHRRVAVKVIKAGMDTRQVVARFEVERAGAGDDGSSQHREGVSTRARPAMAVRTL